SHSSQVSKLWVDLRSPESRPSRLKSAPRHHGTLDLSTPRPLAVYSTLPGGVTCSEYLLPLPLRAFVWLRLPSLNPPRSISPAMYSRSSARIERRPAEPDKG